MIKNWEKFNEEIFGLGKTKSEDSELKPTGVKVIENPDQLRGVSTVKASPKEKNVLTDSRIDSSILQEISDRLYGPDSEEYVKAIQELNTKFRARKGRRAGEFYDASIEAKRKTREQEIINMFK
jgi:hypothetical protein